MALMRFGISEAIALPLVYLGRSGGGITQNELAALIGIGGPSLVRLLDRLVATGLIERRVDAKDKRVKRLALTDEGQALAQRIETVLDDLRATVFAGVSAEDIDACLRVFDHMGRALAQLDGALSPAPDMPAPDMKAEPE